MLKKISIILILLILTIGAVSASDNLTDGDFNSKEISPAGDSFDDVQKAINEAAANYTITLNGTYITSGREIEIHNDVVLEGVGDGATLDGDNKSRILNIVSGNVVLKNINFINANSIANGGAILSNGNLTVFNCSFINNSVISDYDWYFNTHTHGYEVEEIGKGGAIYANGDLSITDSSFIGNSAILKLVLREMDMYYEDNDGEASAILCNGKLHVEKSDFRGNSPIVVLSYNDSEIIGCIFENQSSSLISFGANASIINSIFNNCGSYGCQYEIATNYGVYHNSYINNCSFTNCRNGLIRIYHNGNASIINSMFANNTFNFSRYGDSPIEIDEYALIVNSTFINNFVTNTAVIKVSVFDLKNGTFENNNDATVLSGDIMLDDSLNRTYLFEPKIKNAFKKTYYNSGKLISIDLINVKSGKINWDWFVDVYRNGKYYGDYWFGDSVTFPVSTWKVGKYDVVVYYTNSYTQPNKVTFTVSILKAPTIVKASKITAKFKKSKYFKVTVKHKTTKKIIKNLKVKIKVYTGKKYKTYTVKTDIKGVAKINTKKLKKGSHKVVISSGNSNYKISTKSMIKIK